jgi:hypothetical protein
MLIKMRAIMAGPAGVALVGHIIDRPEAEAKNLIDKGYAEAVEIESIESAVVNPKKEKAVIKGK